MNLLLRSVPVLPWFVLCCLYAAVDLLLRGSDGSNGHRFARLFSWGSLRLLGIRPRVQGSGNLAAHQPCVYVANHQSFLDVPLFGTLYPPRTLVVAKKEIVWIPGFGLLFAAMGNLLIDRAHGDSAVRELRRAARLIREQGLSMWLFPEGTRNHAGGLLPFKKGPFRLALEAGVPLVPVVMDRLSTVVELRRLRLVGGEIGLRVLEPVGTSNRRPEDFEALIAEVRRRMLEALDDLERQRTSGAG